MNVKVIDESEQMMKVLVLGATGRVGAGVVRQALRAGHTITVLVRDPARLASTEGLTVVTGDATSEPDLARALAGQDAVISALGASSTTTELFSSFARALIPAAKAAGVERAIVLSNFGAGDTIAQAKGIQKLIFGTVMKGILADKTKGDDILRASELDWTLAYPVTMSSGAEAGVEPRDALPPHGGRSVTRADVVRFLVNSLTDSGWSRRIAILAA